MRVPVNTCAMLAPVRCRPDFRRVSHELLSSGESVACGSGRTTGALVGIVSGAGETVASVGDALRRKKLNMDAGT
jgi:hypothetical protein